MSNNENSVLRKHIFPLCSVLQVSALCYMMDHAYTKRQLLRMERKVLLGLKFDLSYCSPLHFLLLLASVARCSAKVDLHCVFFVLCEGSRLFSSMTRSCVILATRWCGWLVICWSCLSWRASVWCSCLCSWQEQLCACPAKFCRSPQRQKGKLPGVWPPAFMLAGLFIDS